MIIPVRDSVVIRDDHRPVGRHGHAIRELELAGARALQPELVRVLARAGENLPKMQKKRKPGVS